MRQRKTRATAALKIGDQFRDKGDTFVVVGFNNHRGEYLVKSANDGSLGTYDILSLDDRIFAGAVDDIRRAADPKTSTGDL